MTKAQKNIVEKMLLGHSIAASGRSGYRLRDNQHRPVLKIRATSFNLLKPLLRKTKSGLFLINKNKVRQLHGNDFVKRKYKSLQAMTLVLFIFLVSSCTKNERVKKFGGTAELILPENQKLITVTWKGSDLWYLTKAMSPTDTAEQYQFREESSFGVVQGTYIIKEKKEALAAATAKAWTNNLQSAE